MNDDVIFLDGLADVPEASEPAAVPSEVDVSELRAGEDAVVVRLDESDPLRLRKVLALGILPGVRLTLKRRSPCFVMQVGYSQFAVDAAGARSVFVRRLPNRTAP